MKRKTKAWYRDTSHSRPHLFRIFRFYLLLFFTSFLSFQALAGYSQKFTFNFEKIQVQKILEKIEKQSQYYFVYNHQRVDVSRIASLKIKEESIENILNKLFKNTDVHYSIVDRQIILFKKEDRDYNKSADFLSMHKTDSTKQYNDTTKQKTPAILKGKVLDETKLPLPGVNIIFKGTQRGTITDVEGNFSIKRPAGGKVIVVSMISYKTQEIEIGNQTDITIELQPDVKSLDEVVVTGYQTVDKRTFTGSVSKINVDLISQGGSGDVGKMLLGAVAGVTVENTSGTFGTKSKIRIRGNSSISGNQEPLWVIDGVVLDDPINVNPNQLYSGDANTLLSSAISGVNPDDIEDIQILKDASATAMYGTQAVNGVIVVTTKKGKVGRTSINYRNNFTINLKPSISDFNVMNSKERMEFSEEMFQKNLMNFTDLNRSYGAFGLLLSRLSNKEITWDQYEESIQRAKTYNTDWFDVLFRNSLVQEHSISVSSGTEKQQYYMSASYYHDDGQVKNQHTDRFTASMKGTFNINRIFSVTASLYGSIRDQRIFGTQSATESNGIVSRAFDINPYNYAMNTSRAMRPYNDNGEYEYYLSRYAPFTLLEELDTNFIDLKAREIKFQVDLNLTIPPTLTYWGLASGRMTNSYSEHIATEESNIAKAYRAADQRIRDYNDLLYNDPDDDNQYPVTVLPRGGIAETDMVMGEFYTVRNSLNWKKVYPLHSFDIMGGTEIRAKTYRTDYYKGWGFEYLKGMTASPMYTAIKRDQLTSSSPYYYKGKTVSREVSFFANLAYSLNSKYNFTFSIRSDGSNRLGKSEKFRFLPIWVIGGSWNIDREKFLQKTEWLDYLKLRGSYGLRGNISNLGSPEMKAYYYTTARFEPEANETYIYISSPDNPKLQWEKEKMYNIALEFGLFERINLTLEYYNRKNYDLIGYVAASQVSGFTHRTINCASMRNQGFEITLNTHNIKLKDFDWNTVFTFGYNKNTVLDLVYSTNVAILSADRGGAQKGKPISGLYAFRYAGLTNDGIPLFYNEKNEKTNVISTYDQNISMLQYEGSREPLGSGGFTNTIRYKGLNLSVLFTYSFGNKIRLNPLISNYYNDVSALSGDLVNRWTTPGDEYHTNIPRIFEQETRDRLTASNADPVLFYNRSNLRTADGSFIRLKSITLSYYLPDQWMKTLGIASAQLKAQAQNVALWADKKLKGQDPEALITGIGIPSPKTVSLGLSVDF